MSNNPSLNSSLLGAAIGFGLGGTGRSAIVGAAAGYALNKVQQRKPIFGGRKRRSPKKKSSKKSMKRKSSKRRSSKRSSRVQKSI